jgi:hypothetical protein
LISSLLNLLTPLLKGLDAPGFVRAAPLAVPMAFGCAQLRRACADLCATLRDALLLTEVALLDEKAEHRSHAIKLLTELGTSDPATVVGLEKVALADAETTVRRATAHALSMHALSTPSVLSSHDDGVCALPTMTTCALVSL